MNPPALCFEENYRYLSQATDEETYSCLKFVCLDVPEDGYAGLSQHAVEQLRRQRMRFASPRMIPNYDAVSYTHLTLPTN